MSAHVIRWDGWLLTQEVDRRFRRIFAVVSGPLAILAIIVPLLQFAAPRPQIRIPPPQPHYVQLLPPPRHPVSARRQHSVIRKSAPDTRPSSRHLRRHAGTQESARRLAQQQLRQGGLDTLTAFRQQQPTLLGRGRALAAGDFKSAAPTDTTTQAAAARAAAESTGIAAPGSREGITGSGTGVGQRRTGEAREPAGIGVTGSVGPGDTGFVNRRTRKQVQLVFDHQKAAFYALFQTHARHGGAAKPGSIVVDLTIAPDGSVSHCSVVSNSYDDPGFEQQVLQYVSAMNFGAKRVPPFELKAYPINFMAF